ncbi:MAG: SDR family oxidoreductase [Bryobacteraceae bacterium]
MHVLITGANGGLGEAVTQAFLDRGDRVTGIALSWNGKAPPILALEADMTSADACARAVEQALATGPIEALIHVIGAFAGGTPVAGTDDETWDRMMNLNLRSAFLAFRALNDADRSYRGNGGR